MNTKQVAATILEQLGGRRFAAMTGAKNFTCGRNAEGLDFLTFTLPFNEFNIHAIRYVRVTLTAADDYTVEYMGRNGKVKSTAKEIYCDMLQDCFFEHTNLMTRFGQ